MPRYRPTIRPRCLQAPRTFFSAAALRSPSKHTTLALAPPPPRPPARFQENKLSEHEYFRQCQMPHVRVHNMGYFNSAHGPKFNGSWLDRPYPYIARFAAEGMSAGT